MLSEDQRDHLKHVIGDVEVFASTFAKGADAEVLKQLVTQLSEFQGGPWFSAYCDMQEEGNIFVTHKFNALMLREVDSVSGDPERFFELIVKDAEIPPHKPLPGKEVS